MRPAVLAACLGLVATVAIAAPPPGAPPVQPAKPPSTPAAAPGQPSSRPLEKMAITPPAPQRPNDPILARLSPVYDQCMRRAVSTLDIVECASREGERWDGRLNRAYQARMASFNDRQRGALKRAEKAWLAFREADCAAYEDEDWGTISRIDASQCFLRRTVERALELEAFPADHGPG